MAGRCSGAEQMETEEGVDVREAHVRMSMQPVETQAVVVVVGGVGWVGSGPAVSPCLSAGCPVWT